MEAALVHPGRPRHHLLLQAGGPAPPGADGPDRGVAGHEPADESARLPGDHERQGADGVRRHDGGSGAVGGGAEPADQPPQGEGLAPPKSAECQVGGRAGGGGY